MMHEKRRLPRFHITPCQFQDAALGKAIAVQDLSLGGLALRLVDSEDLPRFAVSSIHRGRIKVDGRKFECQFQVRYIRGALIGAEWVEPGPEFKAHLHELSHPGRLGENLKKYEIEDLNATDWFHNPIGVDLLFYPTLEGGSGPGRWMLYIHQNFVQWESESGVQTGQALSEADEGYSHGIMRIETRLIEFDSSVDRSLLKAARELLEHAPIESLELKNIVLSHLNGVV
jgi:hypothetical protein